MQKTLHTLINCIEEHGIAAVSLRHIAEACDGAGEGVTPDRALLARAMQASIDNSLPDVREILRGPGLLEERLETLLSFLVHGAERHPNLSRAHLRTGRYVFLLSEEIASGLDDNELAAEGLCRHELQEGLALAVSAAIFAGLNPAALSPLRVPTVPRSLRTNGTIRALMALLPAPALRSGVVI